LKHHEILAVIPIEKKLQQMENQTPTLQDWLSSNPGKTPNDYFQAFPQALNGQWGQGNSSQSPPVVVIQQPAPIPVKRSSFSTFEWTLWIIAIALAVAVGSIWAVQYFENQKEKKEITISFD